MTMSSPVYMQYLIYLVMQALSSGAGDLSVKWCCMDVFFDVQVARQPCKVYCSHHLFQVVSCGILHYIYIQYYDVGVLF